MTAPGAKSSWADLLDENSNLSIASVEFGELPLNSLSNHIEREWSRHSRSRGGVDTDLDNSRAGVNLLISKGLNLMDDELSRQSSLGKRTRDGHEEAGREAKLRKNLNGQSATCSPPGENQNVKAVPSGNPPENLPPVSGGTSSTTACPLPRDGPLPSPADGPVLNFLGILTQTKERQQELARKRAADRALPEFGMSSDNSSLKRTSSTCTNSVKSPMTSVQAISERGSSCGGNSPSGFHIPSTESAGIGFSWAKKCFGDKSQRSAAGEEAQNASATDSAGPDSKPTPSAFSSCPVSPSRHTTMSWQQPSLTPSPLAQSGTKPPADASPTEQLVHPGGGKFEPKLEKDRGKAAKPEAASAKTQGEADGGKSEGGIQLAWAPVRQKRFPQVKDEEDGPSAPSTTSPSRAASVCSDRSGLRVEAPPFEPNVSRSRRGSGAGAAGPATPDSGEVYFGGMPYPPPPLFYPHHRQHPPARPLKQVRRAPNKRRRSPQRNRVAAPPTAAQVAKRQTQIRLGKSTQGYKNYCRVVPRNKRHARHPRTPDVHDSISKRRFDGKVRSWRRQLHEFDDPITEDPLCLEPPSVVMKEEAGPQRGFDAPPSQLMQKEQEEQKMETVRACTDMKKEPVKLLSAPTAERTGAVP